MADNKLEIFRKILADADSVNSISSASQYLKRVQGFLSSAFSQEVLFNYEKLTSTGRDIYDKVSAAVGFLEGLYERTYSDLPEVVNLTTEKEIKQRKQLLDIFIVHGRDNEAKEIVARFIHKIGLTPIILHEQPNNGKTIIEKFELFSDVSYAVVLLTPDDLGALTDEKEQLKSRARQNVILELGYFMGKLGRNNVCALVRNNVELPSDYHGILYIEFDSNGAWKTKLAQEFVQAKLEIKLEGLLK